MPSGMMTVRLVRLLDDPKGTGYGRQEIMLVYGEDVAPTGLSFDDLTTDGKPNARWAKLERPLTNRAIRSFRITDDGP